MKLAQLAFAFALCAGVTIGTAAPVNMEAASMAVTTWLPNSPLYATPIGAGYEGVGGLILDFGGNQFALCSGSLVGPGAILTAAHCVSDAQGNLAVQGGSATFFTPSNPGGETYGFGAEDVFIHPDWDANFFRGNDLAVIKLNSPVSAEITPYDLYRGSGEVGSTIQSVGYGASGLGAIGTCDGSAQCGGVVKGLPAGTRRRVFNEFDATGSSFLFPGGSRILLSDFDNGQAANDAFGFWLGLNGLGLGLLEGQVAPGDSGGPSFVNGEVAGITSFGLRLALGQITSDVTPFLDASFGEFAGYTRVSSYADWIDQVVAVPEPSTGLLVLGALAAGIVVRRLRAKRV